MLDIHIVDGVHVVTMQAEENRFNAASVGALDDALTSVAATGAPLVLTGSGRFFSNGLDLDWMAEAGADAAGPTMRRLDGVLARLLAWPGATVAAVNGHAFGAGAILAAALDERVMRADRGYFCFPEVDLGMAMSPGFDALLQARYPRQVLLRALVSGHRHDGDAARAAGLVDESVPEDRVLPAAIARAAALAPKDGATIGRLKAVLYARELAVLAGSGAG
ncbi:MAG TPA: enoyl-CoA hydratase/isomerase family protein [Acidimicrobiales bacterium]|nr:enoyl-CoA hydratase/isomerase family protein [Acidimicrobiales bacterium]